MSGEEYREAVIVDLEDLIQELKNSPGAESDSADAWVAGAMSRARATEESEVSGFAARAGAGSAGSAGGTGGAAAAGAIWIGDEPPVPIPNPLANSRTWCTSRYVCSTFGGSWLC